MFCICVWGKYSYELHKREFLFDLPYRSTVMCFRNWNYAKSLKFSSNKNKGMLNKKNDFQILFASRRTFHTVLVFYSEKGAHNYRTVNRVQAANQKFNLGYFYNDKLYLLWCNTTIWLKIFKFCLNLNSFIIFFTNRFDKGFVHHWLCAINWRCLFHSHLVQNRSSHPVSNYNDCK